MKKILILLVALAASSALVEARGPIESGAAADSSASANGSVDPAGTVMTALRRACTSSSREAAANWCELAFTQ